MSQSVQEGATLYFNRGTLSGNSFTAYTVMKITILIVALATCLGTMGFAEGPCTTGVRNTLNGKTYQSDICQTDLMASPPWNPSEQPEPPIAPGKAVALATAKLTDLFPSLANQWRLEKVMLNWVYQPDHWYYQVIFAPGTRPGTGMKKGEVRTVPAFSILILMDGKVMEPKLSEKQQ